MMLYRLLATLLTRSKLIASNTSQNDCLYICSWQRPTWLQRTAIGCYWFCSISCYCTYFSRSMQLYIYIRTYINNQGLRVILRIYQPLTMTSSCSMQCGSRPHRDLHGHWHHDVPVGGHTECQHIWVCGENEDKENTDGAECSKWHGVKYKQPPTPPTLCSTPPTAPILQPTSYTYCMCIRMYKVTSRLPVLLYIITFPPPHTLHPPTSLLHQPLSTPPSQLHHTHHPKSSHPTHLYICTYATKSWMLFYVSVNL